MVPRRGFLIIFNMINIEILKDIKVKCISNICCFSGDCQKREVLLKQGSKYVFDRAVPLDNNCYNLVLDNERADDLHPDRLCDVPADAIKIGESYE